MLENRDKASLAGCDLDQERECLAVELAQEIYSHFPECKEARDLALSDAYNLPIDKASLDTFLTLYAKDSIAYFDPATVEEGQTMIYCDLKTTDNKFRRQLYISFLRPPYNFVN